MLERLPYLPERRAASCSIAGSIKPDIAGACMLVEHVSQHDQKGPLFYSLKDSKGTVLREGITERNLSARINEYKKEPWFPTVKQVCIQPFNDSQRLKSYERARVGCDCPPYNKRLKSSCP